MLTSIQAVDPEAPQSDAATQVSDLLEKVRSLQESLAQFECKLSDPERIGATPDYRTSEDSEENGPPPLPEGYIQVAHLDFEKNQMWIRPLWAQASK